MKSLFISALALAVVSCSSVNTETTKLSGRSTASEGSTLQTICGKRKGTAGEVYLEKKGKPVLTLASQGNDQSAAEKADSFIPGGMQVDAKYCVNALLNNEQEVLAVLGAYEDKDKVKTHCGVRIQLGEIVSLMDDGKILVNLAKNGDSSGLVAVDHYIQGKTQNGEKYCVNGSLKKQQFKLVVGAFLAP